MVPDPISGISGKPWDPSVCGPVAVALDGDSQKHKSQIQSDLQALFQHMYVTPKTHTGCWLGRATWPLSQMGAAVSNLEHTSQRLPVQHSIKISSLAPSTRTIIA
jgi:hypothetical protein